MVHHLPITKARINLGQVVRRVHLNKEYVILEKDGIPIAGLMDADELEDYLELRDSKAQRTIKQSAADVRAGRTRPASALLAEFRTADAAKNRSHGAALHDPDSSLFSPHYQRLRSRFPETREAAPRPYRALQPRHHHP
jgi:PHD/YefM family antitoxin component YafN of YafNO toxin-antitoxin module